MIGHAPRRPTHRYGKDTLHASQPAVAGQVVLRGEPADVDDLRNDPGRGEGPDPRHLHQLLDRRSLGRKLLEHALQVP